MSWDISPNGEYGLSASADNTIILWETSTGNFVKEFTNDSTLNLRGAYLLSDNNHFALCDDNRLIIRDVSKGKTLQELKGIFKSILVCERRNEFALLSYDSSILVYRLNKGLYEKVKVIRAKEEITALSYSENESVLIYYDGKIKTYDPVNNRSLEFDFSLASNHALQSLALNSDKSKFAIGTTDGKIYLYDSKLQKRLDSLINFITPSYWAATSEGFFRDSAQLDLPVTHLAFQGTNRIEAFYSGWEWDNHGRGPKFHYIVWDLPGRKESMHKSDLTPWYNAYDFSKGRLFCDYEIFDLKQNSTLPLQKVRTSIQNAKFASSGKKILISKPWRIWVKNENQELTRKEIEQKWVWDITDGNKYTFDINITKPEFNSSTNLVGVSNPDNAIKIDSTLEQDAWGNKHYKYAYQNAPGFFDLNEQKIIKYAKDLNYPEKSGQLLFHPAKPHIIVADGQATMVYDYEQDKVIKKLRVRSGNTFSKNGRILKGGKYIYDATSYEIIDSMTSTYIRKPNVSYDELVRIRIEPGYFFSFSEGLFLTKKNKYLFQGDYDRIYVRDYKKHLLTDSLSFGGSAMEVSADENKLVFGFLDGTIQFIDPDNLKTVKKIKAHIASVNSIDFSPDNRFIMTSGDDGTIKFWDTKSYAELAKIIFYGDDWVVVTPDYLFDGSPGGLENLFFIDGLKTIDLNQVKDRFYEPGLLQKVLGYSKEPLRKSLGLNNIKPFPKIDIEDPAKNDKGGLTIHLTNEGGGIGKVKILINGKEASVDARSIGFNPDADKTTILFKLANHPYLKQNELNQIEVLASNKEGYLTSKPKKLHYFAEGTLRADIKLYAVIIGTSDYNGTELDLRFASKDAEQFADALEQTGKKLFGVNSVSIQLLTTDRKENWPTKENIQNAFKKISTATSSDMLVVYLAGHGTNFGGTEGDFYYLTATAKNGNLSDPAIRQQVAISSSEFTEYILWGGSLKQVMILDACHSGKFAEDLLTKREAKSSSEIRALERMKDRVGLFILAGSASDAVSYEASVYGQGLLTYSLLFGMKGAALRDNQFVDVMELFQYCADEVPKLAANIGGIQKPEIRVPLAGESFDIGIMDDNIREKIKLPTPKPVFLRSVFQDEETFGDPLGLSEYLDQQLKTQEVTKGGTEIIFIDAMKFSDAYTLRGRYKKVGSSYEVSCKLLKGDKLFKDLTATGDSLEVIGRKIIEQSINSLEQK